MLMLCVHEKLELISNIWKSFLQIKKSILYHDIFFSICVVVPYEFGM